MNKLYIAGALIIYSSYLMNMNMENNIPFELRALTLLSTPYESDQNKVARLLIHTYKKCNLNLDEDQIRLMRAHNVDHNIIEEAKNLLEPKAKL